ncbi:hypothetical protein [Bradyrhizobium sp.]|uniref:hypothetical protein n=1 Tax=Bradyrhizobium sp. TaxID=376 RepID=UPI0040379D31
MKGTTAMLFARTILAITWVSSIQPAWADDPGRTDPALPDRCKLLTAELHRLQELQEDILRELQVNERNARALGDWYGREHYQPYVDTIRAQRRQIEAQQSLLAQTSCAAAGQ